MTLLSTCIDLLAQPKVIEIHKNQLSLIPVYLKIKLLKKLCIRNCLKDEYILKQLVNPKITEVDLSECDVTDNTLKCFFTCENLRKLDLSLRRRQSRHISTKVLNSLFWKKNQLKVVVVPYCQEFNDEVVQTLSENCPHLTELHIPNTPVTDISLTAIGKNLKEISVLNFQGTQITDKGVEVLVEGPLSKVLTELNVDRCPNITSYSSIIIAKKCENIRIFSCGSCGTDEETVLAMNGIRSKVKQIFWRL